MNIFFFFHFISVSLPSFLSPTNTAMFFSAQMQRILATTLWTIQLNQPIREQLNQDSEGTRAVDAHSSWSHPKVRGHDMNLILYVWWVSSGVPMCSSTAPAECLFLFMLHLPLFTSSVSFRFSAYTHPECLNWKSAHLRVSENLVTTAVLCSCTTGTHDLVLLTQKLENNYYETAFTSGNHCNDFV